MSTIINLMYIGIDLGGTKIETIVIDQDFNELVRRRTQTPRHDYQATLMTIKELIEDATAELSIRQQSTAKSLPIGIGIPGSINQSDHYIQNANSTWLNEKSLQKDLQKTLNRPVRLANDANCFALSETIDGTAKGAKSCFGVILGTGVGSGLMINGQLLHGFQNISGEWGHNPLPDETIRDFKSRQCWCGKQNCIEAFCSGPGLSASYFEKTGKKKNAAQIAKAYQTGEKESRAVFALYLKQLASGLSTVINIIDPEVIVLGGGLSNMKPLYDQLPSLIKPLIFARRPMVNIKPPKYGDSSGVRGAAFLWHEALMKKSL